MKSIKEALEVISRLNFLPESMKDRADIDAPIPIGFGQTNSQPTTVRLMLSWLHPKLGEKILDVGSGSGWTTALLAYLVGPKGKVYAVEKIPELVRFGAANCKKVGIKNAMFFEASSSVGLPKYAPFDKILVSAAASKLPNELLGQLKVNGHMVIPIENSIYVIHKTSEESYESTLHPGFAFVPLV